MRFLPILIAFFVCAFATDPYASLFDDWCRENGKSYASDSERQARLAVFADNAAFVFSHNSNSSASYTLALNDFADLTVDEFRAARLGLAGAISDAARDAELGLERVPFELDLGASVPDSVDWREQGAVTEVKNQGSCGACWSFSATGAIEGINKIVSGSLVSLSEQELIDCDNSYNAGCNGGLMDYAFKFVVKNKGIDSEDDYPFKTADAKCNKNKLERRVVTIDGYTDVPVKNEDALLQAVAKQPVSVGICGSGREFQLYSQGIFTGPCPTSLDHAVLLVGYGSENSQDYWIVKNSWGQNWGLNGYMHMLRNSGDSVGMCGVNMMPSYPTKTSPNPPPSPGPSPTKCSLLTYCPAGNTCCCSWRVLGFCLSWGCCELDSAVCCKDNSSCCPQYYPVCDTVNQQCLKAGGNTSSVEGIKMKNAFSKVPWNNVLDVLEQ